MEMEMIAAIALIVCVMFVLPVALQLLRTATALRSLQTRTKEEPTKGLTDTSVHGVGTFRLLPGEELQEGQRMVSPSRKYRLEVQRNGDVAIYGPTSPGNPTGFVWHTDTVLPTTEVPAHLAFQLDGNLCLYGPVRNVLKGGKLVPASTLFWSVHLVGTEKNRRLELNDRGNLSIFYDEKYDTSGWGEKPRFDAWRTKQVWTNGV